MKEKVGSKRFSITSDEWVVIASISILSLTFIATLPHITTSMWFSEIIPPFQYLIYNIGFILLTVLLIGLPTSRLLKDSFHFWTTFRTGISSWLIFSFVLDLWQPAFSYGTDGQLLIVSKEALAGTSVDYMLGWLYSSLAPALSQEFLAIPFVGEISSLYLCIYLLTPILSIFIAALIMKPQFLVQLFNQNT